MTKYETLDAIKDKSWGAAFAANIVLHQFSNPARKLKGILSLVNADHRVQVAWTKSGMSYILVDGYRVEDDVLDRKDVVEFVEQGWARS